MAANKRLLVADDSLTIQKVIRLALSSEGYEIQTVSDGNDAVQQISLFRPDVVLIDVSLPGKSAFEVKQTVNEQGDFDELRFVLMSSAFEKVDEEQAAQVVFHGRLTKPFDPAHLRQILADVLAQVAAKRMEATSLLQKPSAPPAPPTDAVSSFPDEPMPKITLSPPDELPVPEQLDELSGDVMAPIQPKEDQPIFPPPPEERISSLWEAKEQLHEGLDLEGIDLPPPLPNQKISLDPPVAPPSVPQGGADSDIRHLTESTIRMSGLDDFQWSVAPPGELPPDPPALRPFDEMSDLGGTRFQIDPPGEAFSKTQPEAFQQAPRNNNHPELQLIQPPPAPLSTPAGQAPSDPTVVPLTTGQMEELIQKQLQETLERMARQILPEVAERIIKQEINRMLHERV